MDEVSLQVDAGEGGGPISVFTSSGLLSVLRGQKGIKIIGFLGKNYTPKFRHLCCFVLLKVCCRTKKMDALDFLGFGGLLHSLEAFW